MKTYLGIGLMSGTSLDGLDICLVRYHFPNPGFEILKTETFPYPAEWEKRLKNSIFLSGEELSQLDVDYGFYLGQTVQSFIEKHKIENLDFIASHGHTVFHNPKNHYTLQIGKGEAIFAETGIRTIYDFRTADVIFGGQGAPLVPIGDAQLFGEFDACLNLGGFSNISFEKNRKRIAFDICPVNIVLNHLTEKLGKAFDRDGEIAKSGKVDQKLLEQLNKLVFYEIVPPKSLGIEWCNENIFPVFETSDLSIEDLISTFTKHVSVQISKILNRNSIQNVLITGGGAYNKFLIRLIKKEVDTELIIPEKSIIEFKESLIFGWMGVLRLENQINILSSVTGAKTDHSAGIIVGENN